METEKVLFVFYTLGSCSGRWDYPNLPEKWRWVGAGNTSPSYTSTSTKPSKKLEYEREEQFQGLQKTQKKTVNYLNKVFHELKKQKVIKKYKIRHSYLP